MQDANPVLIVRLPYPPSVNQLLASVRSRLVQTKVARDYFAVCVRDIWSQLEPSFSPFTKPVGVAITIHPPTRRKFDLDNRIKSLQDSLQQSGVLINDNQIDELHVARGKMTKGGLVKLKVFSL